MSNINRIPFTEQYERVKAELVRDDAAGTASEAKYKGFINDVYMVELPTKVDLKHIRKTANIITVADYSVGTITSISSTTVTGSSTAWTSANSNNLLFKHDSFDEVYRVTYVSAASLTLNTAWSEGTVTAGGTYQLAQDRYALASDFDEMAEDPNKSVYYWSGGTKQYLEYLTQDQWDEQFNFTLSSSPGFFTIKWLDGTAYIHLLQIPDSTFNIYYDYVPRLTALTEYTTGSASCTNGATAVTGTSTDFDGFVTGSDTYYLRFDGDGTGSNSVWYQVSSASSDTAITLSTAYGGATKTTASYTISKLSLFPPALDLAVIYRAAALSGTTQDNAIQIQAWDAFYTRVAAQFHGRDARSPGNQRLRTIYEDPGVRR